MILYMLMQLDIIREFDKTTFANKNFCSFFFIRVFSIFFAKRVCLTCCFLRVIFSISFSHTSLFSIFCFCFVMTNSLIKKKHMNFTLFDFSVFDIE